MRNLINSIFAKTLVVSLSILLVSPSSFAQIQMSIQESYLPQVIHAQGEVNILQEPEMGAPKKMDEG